MRKLFLSQKKAKKKEAKKHSSPSLRRTWSFEKTATSVFFVGQQVQYQYKKKLEIVRSASRSDNQLTLDSVVISARDI